MIQLLVFYACITQGTVKNYIHAYFNYNSKVINYLAENYDLIVAHENKRSWNPILRERKRIKGGKLILLLYKDYLTIIGPDNPWFTQGDDVMGGGATVGGFYHFDSLFRGVQSAADTVFLMAGPDTRTFDAENRAQVGDSGSSVYRWAMDFGKGEWADYFARNAKMQCLRGAGNKAFDRTYYDGVFIDDIIHSNADFGLYPAKYWNPGNPARSDSILRSVMLKSVIRVAEEFHHSSRDAKYMKSMLVVGNINKAWLVEGLWQSYLIRLDGGMEETNFADTALEYADFKKIIDEISFAEGKKKICLVHKQVSSRCGNDPMSVAVFDTAQMMYGLTAYLLGCNTRTYFSFGGDYEHVFWAPVLDLDLGRPIGKYEILADYVMRRSFQKGLVYCNPTDDVKTIDLPPRKYSIINANREKVGYKALLLKPHQGVILVKN